MLGLAGGSRVACVAALVLLATAAPASAQLGPVQGVADATAESVTSAPGEIEALANGEQSAPTTASNILCPPASEVGALLDEHADETPLGGVGAGLTSLACSADLLQFDFFTRWTPAGGSPQTRTTRAVVGVPTLLEADGDSQPDLIGTLTVSGNDLAMVVERFPGEEGAVPASVEAVLTDSSRRVIGREHLAFGYDARADRAPGKFTLSTPVETLLRPQSQYRFDVAQEGRGETIALLGSVFDGGIANRRNPTEVRLDYGASPDTASVEASTGDGVTATLTTNRPGPATLSGRIVDGSAVDSVEVGFEDLPTSLTLGLDSDTGTVTYSASAPMNRLSAKVDTSAPTFLNARHFEATLLSVPQALTLTLGQDASNITLEADEPIGQLDFRARSADRAYPDIPAGEAGATVDATGGELALALRLFDLRRIAVSLDPIVFEADMRGGQTFTIDARLPGSGGPIEADIVFDPLPAQISFTVDSDTGELSYEGSAPMDRLFASVRSGSPVLLEATHVEAEMLSVPQSFDLTVGQESDEFALTADQPIGQIDIKARSANRSFPAIPAGEAGVVYDDRGPELALALRVFQLERLAVRPDPLLLEAKMEGGRKFTATVDLDTSGGPVHAEALFDRLPAVVSVGLRDLSAGGSALDLTGSAPIGFLRLAAEGVELLPGADNLEVEINDLPTNVSVELPETGELAKLVANAPIGQLRIAASDDGGALPARSYLPGDTVRNDLFRFRDVPGDFAIGIRLTAVREIGVNLDPVNLTLKQDASRTRPVDIDASFLNGTTPITVTGLLNKPHSTTSISVVLTSGQATRVVFDNSANMASFELHARNLGSVKSADAVFTNVSKRLSMCLDPGPRCQRPNPHGLSRYSPTVASIDFDDFGSQNAGQFTTLNANIELTSGDPVQISNLRFRNLSLDFGDSGQTASCLGQKIPKVHLFFDSRGQQFVMNSIKLPPTIRDFRIGTDGNPATASNRLVKVEGWNFACAGIDSEARGSMNCGGQRNLTVSLGALGNVNLLNFLGFQLVPVCS